MGTRVTHPLLRHTSMGRVKKHQIRVLLAYGSRPYVPAVLNAPRITTTQMPHHARSLLLKYHPQVDLTVSPQRASARQTILGVFVPSRRPTRTTIPKSTDNTARNGVNMARRTGRISKLASMKEENATSQLGGGTTRGLAGGQCLGG
jgi:hypothetical protein